MLARNSAFHAMSLPVSMLRTSSSNLLSAQPAPAFSSRGPRLSSGVMRMAFSSLAFSARRGARSVVEESTMEKAAAAPPGPSAPLPRSGRERRCPPAPHFGIGVTCSMVTRKCLIPEELHQVEGAGLPVGRSRRMSWNRGRQRVTPRRAAAASSRSAGLHAAPRSRSPPPPGGGAAGGPQLHGQGHVVQLLLQGGLLAGAVPRGCEQPAC